LRTGSILVDDGDSLAYLTWFVSFCIFFFLANIFLKQLFTYLARDSWTRKTDAEKGLYIGTWGANLHHFIIVPMVIWNLCNSSCDGAWNLLMASDEVCLISINKHYVNAQMVNLAYFTIDYLHLISLKGDELKSIV
jgi:hypothetical protein